MRQSRDIISTSGGSPTISWPGSSALPGPPCLRHRRRPISRQRSSSDIGTFFCFDVQLEEAHDASSRSQGKAGAATTRSLSALLPVKKLKCAMDGDIEEVRGLACGADKM